jgi:hypothetical protein
MRLKQDVAAGLIFAGTGVAGLWLGQEYDFGSARTMGPGYLPTLLCWGLIALGAVIAVKGIFAAGEFVDRWRLRPLVFVLGAVAVFAMAIESAGLALTVFAATFIAAFAGGRPRMVETLVLALMLAVGAVALFIHGLSLPLSAFPT